MSRQKYYVITTYDGRQIDTSIEVGIEDIPTFISELLDQYSDQMDTEISRSFSVEYEHETWGTLRGTHNGTQHEITVHVKKGIL